MKVTMYRHAIAASLSVIMTTLLLPLSIPETIHLQLPGFTQDWNSKLPNVYEVLNLLFSLIEND